MIAPSLCGYVPPQIEQWALVPQMQVGGPSGPCEDKDANCDAWAASGECEKNPGEDGKSR